MTIFTQAGEAVRPTDVGERVMDHTQITPVVLGRVSEQLRQERVTFDQARQHEARWFVLRLVMGYAAVSLLAAIMVVASYVLFNASGFPATVVAAASAALFVDVVGLLIAVWKIALNPSLYALLGPVTRVDLSDVRSSAVAYGKTSRSGKPQRLPHHETTTSEESGRQDLTGNPASRRESGASNAAARRAGALSVRRQRGTDGSLGQRAQRGGNVPVHA
jgi:hypothetical protein